MALRNFHRIEIRTDHLLVHSWLDHHILDRRHTMNHLVNWLECIDATKKWTKIEEIIIFIREKNRQKQNKLRQFCSKNLRIGLLQRNWLDHRILVPASKWNSVHLGYSYGRIDSVVDKSKFGVSCYFQIICIFAKFIAASNANLINWIMRRRNICIETISAYHRLWSRSRMHMCVRWAGSHCSCMARCCSSVLMRECLEVHCFRWIHLFAEAKQMERCIRANFIFHALDGQWASEWMSKKTVGKTNQLIRDMINWKWFQFKRLFIVSLTQKRQECDTKLINRQFHRRICALRSFFLDFSRWQ